MSRKERWELKGLQETTGNRELSADRKDKEG